MTKNELAEYLLGQPKQKPFADYGEFTQLLFACVNIQLEQYISNLKLVFSSENGTKNVLYPDIDIACRLCEKQVSEFNPPQRSADKGKAKKAETSTADELDSLFAEFAKGVEKAEMPPVSKAMADIIARAQASDKSFPIFEVYKKLELNEFSLFALSCAILSSTQTNYASVFQVINQNGSYSAPTVEAAARVFYGADYSMTGSYGEMSLAISKLGIVLDLRINPEMPFSTVLAPDKRLIDFLFSQNAGTPDENYGRFFNLLCKGDAPGKIIANTDKLDALAISYDDGHRIFSIYGDEGSGRKFTIKHFCTEKKQDCIVIDCAKLFKYDFGFVDKALWAASRECVLLNACCCLSELDYREDEKEKIFGYMDLAFEKLTSKSITVFTISRDKLPLREMTKLDFTQMELPTPSNTEREELWRHYSDGYAFEPDISLEEMATKFLFTAGKIKSALRKSRSLSSMEKSILITRKCLFEACYSQMSHELTQKATKIKATYTWDDIIMSKDQRQALEYACDQMRYRKQVYEQWDYNRKYPYGRGLSVLLFGAPGTGKSMCAQVLANALNLELYRVDLSKVVDKYVGETEKSISMIFREAKKCNVVLFFDECDTLFAKRSDDGGSGQASNNNKTALLLQEVEAYDGVSVLATNYKHNIDPAFFRRMKFIVEFQFPDPKTRYVLWKATIPKNTPLAEDVDIQFLADRFEFVGGNIKNCILNAAFLAAGDMEADGQVHMKHYLQAIRYEFVKTGKVFTKADFEPYANQVL